MKTISILSLLFAVSACFQAERNVQSVQTTPPAQPAQPAVSPAATKVVTNSIGIEFIAIPAGSFAMGASNNQPDADNNEKPQHSVTINKPFSISKYEVTQAQWEAVMGSNPYTLDRSNPFYDLPGMKERITRPTHPATVSWNDAQAFIRQLNAKEGHTRYRLPTEAEWEYVARAGTTTAYSFADNISDLGRYAWYGDDFASGGTHPVGQKLSNPWGLYDVHGNAWEWVQDWYGENYYAQSPSTYPKGSASGSQRVVRGGMLASNRRQLAQFFPQIL